MNHLFISYKHEDGDFADVLINKLEKEGYSTWVDNDRINAGEDWRNEIDQAIKDAFALIVIMSPEAKASEYVTYEWAFAWGAGVKVIPVLFKPTELHPRLEALQYLDFTSRTSRPWNKLFNVVKNATIVHDPHEAHTQQRAEDEQKSTQLRDQTERDIALDNQREVALQEYIDKISELLLERHLRESHPEDEVRKIARARTLTVLPRLDGMRKRNVLQFLYESGLINKSGPIVELSGADLWQADLNGIYLRDAHLGGSLCWKVDFSDAFLHGAYLGGIQFREVTWNGADLSEAYLEGATFLDADGKPRKDATGVIIEELEKKVKSLQGAIMPDGKIHP